MITEEKARKWQSLTPGSVGFPNTLGPKSRENVIVLHVDTYVRAFSRVKAHDVNNY